MNVPLAFSQNVGYFYLVFTYLHIYQDVLFVLYGFSFASADFENNFLREFTWAKNTCEIKKFSPHTFQLAELLFSAEIAWRAVAVLHILCIYELFV